MQVTKDQNQCGGCGRPVRSDGECVYCGSAAARAPQQADAMQRATYREGATVVPYVVACALLGWMGWWFGRHAALVSHGGGDQLSAVLIAAFCVICGPGIAAYHFLVTRRRRVEILPSAGLRVGSHLRVGWDEIEAVAWRRGVFATSPTGAMGSHGQPSLAAQRVAGWAVLARAAFYPLLPAAWYLTPFSPRVQLHLRGGRRISLRDLSSAGEFVRAVRSRAGS